MNKYPILSGIQKENDIHSVPKKDWKKLSREIRSFLIHQLSRTGGHLASNLGAVELTMALHLVLDLPKDKIIWDVGHQSYTHKILTGRKELFPTLRMDGGLSGFPKTKESPCDVFNTGHSSTSISAGLGLCEARDLRGTDETIVACLGDGSLTGGMAYEALNNASRLKTNFLIILNDNDMSIDSNVGGISRYLDSIRTAPGYRNLKTDISEALESIPKIGKSLVRGISRTKDSIKQLMIPGMFFENMGIQYLGPVDGHNIPQLVEAIKEAITLPNAVLLHVKTVKGKGYSFAEKEPRRFHGVAPFHASTGIPRKEDTSVTYTKVFSEEMVNLGKDESVVAITAAMPDGTGLMEFRDAYPDRFFDVGIAEEHAVTFAAGLAMGGYKPYVAIYSSFLQRAFDQILHDVSLQSLPVVFCLDRSGLVGADGETHQGIFDISYLSAIPGMTLMAPKNASEFRAMLHFAKGITTGPVAIRYPKGNIPKEEDAEPAPIELGKAELLQDEGGVLLLAYGSAVEELRSLLPVLKEKGKKVSLVNLRFAKPLDTKLILQLAKKASCIVSMEENVRQGGVGQGIAELLESSGITAPFVNLALPNGLVEHGSVSEQKAHLKRDPASVLQILEALGEETHGKG